MRDEQAPDDSLDTLIEAGRYADAREMLGRMPAAIVAGRLRSAGARNSVLIFRLLPRPLASEVLSHLETEVQDALLKELSDQETSELLARLEPDDRTHLLEELPGQAIQRLLNLLNPADLEQARLLLGYPAESVGRLMTPDYVAVRPEWSIGRCLDHIRARARNAESAAVIYVTDARWTLLDAIEVQRFVLAAPEESVETIMDRTFFALRPQDDRERAVDLILDYDLIAAPVVDSDGVLLGVVTVDDVVDVLEKETTEDFQKTGAVAPLKTSYRYASVGSLFRKRIPWLGGLVVVNLVASGVLAANEATLSSSIALAFFLPLLMASAGNAGAQSATLTIRALATGDLDRAGWVRSMAKEAVVGCLLGVAMAAGAWALGWFRSGHEVAIVVGTTMVAIVCVGNLIGAALPFVLAELGLDPAVASNPLITSIADITSLLIYFAVASRLL